MINGIYCALLVAPYSISAGMNGSVTNMQSASKALIGDFFFFKNQVFVLMFVTFPSPPSALGQGWGLLPRARSARSSELGQREEACTE